MTIPFLVCVLRKQLCTRIHIYIFDMHCDQITSRSKSLTGLPSKPVHSHAFLWCNHTHTHTRPYPYYVFLCRVLSCVLAMPIGKIVYYPFEWPASQIFGPSLAHIRVQYRVGCIMHGLGTGILCPGPAWFMPCPALPSLPCTEVRTCSKYMYSVRSTYVSVHIICTGYSRTLHLYVRYGGIQSTDARMDHRRSIWCITLTVASRVYYLPYPVRSMYIVVSIVWIIWMQGVI